MTLRNSVVPVTASTLTGMTLNQVAFGNSTGGLQGSANLTFNGSTLTLTGAQSISGQLTSTLATGTAPFVVASTTAVANLNASLLLGSTWASPGSIGATTPNAGAFTTLSASGTATMAAINVSGSVSIAQNSANNFLGEGTGWIWTSTGLTGGTKRGGIYAQSAGTLNLFGGASIAAHLAISAAGDVSVSNTTASSSTTTGALVVSGGVGVAGNAWIGGALGVASTTNLSTNAAALTPLTLNGPSGGFDMRFVVGGGANTNWHIGITYNVGNAFEITPSTSAGGSTYTNPALAIGPTGTTSLKTTDAGTNTRPNTLLIGHNTSGTPASGFGSTLRFQAQTTTLADQDLAMVESLWTTPTHASRTGRVAYSVFDSVGARECLRMEANGSAAAIGLYGASAVAQYATTGTATGFTAGAGTTVTHLSTFTGNTGSTAYTIGDVVRALKLIGAIAS